DDQVLFPDGGETVAAMIADALGEPGVIGLELQVGALGNDQLGKIRQAHQTLDDHDLGFVEVEMRGDELALPRRRRLSSDSNIRTRSSASSSTSTSLSRRMRNMPQPETAWPGNSLSK